MGIFSAKNAHVCPKHLILNGNTILIQPTTDIFEECPAFSAVRMSGQASRIEAILLFGFSIPVGFEERTTYRRCRRSLLT